MITLIALFRFLAVEHNLQTKKKGRTMSRREGRSNRNTRSALTRSVFPSLGAIVLLTFVQACQYRPGIPITWFCEKIDEAPVTPASGAPPALVFPEVPGTIKAMHGSASAHLDKQKGGILKIEQSIDIPSYANQAAVFLNGWWLKYSDDEHYVWGLATAIGKIKVQPGNPAVGLPGKLTWNAVGTIQDEDATGERAMDWRCYYTVVAWNDQILRASVDQGDVEQFCEHPAGTPSPSNNFFLADNTGTTTALSWFPSFLHNASLAAGSAVAILPRGFGFHWWGPDRHLLQVGYNLEHRERFIQSVSYKKGAGELNPLPTPPTGRADSGFVSWGSYSIYKDNAARRDYQFAELVSLVHGLDVRVIEPPFSILPRVGEGSHAVVQLDRKDVVIDNIPYAYAIPMLTGWNLNYPDTDHEVREIGIWLDDVHYAAGTLSYKVTAVLHDDSGNGHFSDHKVTILGLHPVAPSPPPTPQP
jgi:hypothetical protein